MTRHEKNLTSYLVPDVFNLINLDQKRPVPVTTRPSRAPRSSPLPAGTTRTELATSESSTAPPSVTNQPSSTTTRYDTDSRSHPQQSEEHSPWIWIALCILIVSVAVVAVQGWRMRKIKTEMGRSYCKGHFGTVGALHFCPLAHATNLDIAAGPGGEPAVLLSTTTLSTSASEK